MKRREDGRKRDKLRSQSLKFIKNMFSRLCYSSNDELLSAIQNVSAVSFDIFDTLVKRDVPFPETVHLLTKRRYAEQTGREIPDYQRRRIAAEQQARKFSGGKEITLKDIFDCFSDLSDEEKRLLYKLEQQAEYDVCCVNPCIKPVYDQAAILGKRIVITSDMYLPEGLIERILKKCGIGKYDKLYLSSACGAAKASGKLFDILMADMGCKGSSILHIGDNIKADYFRSKQRGIRACLINGRQSRLCYWKRKDAKSCNQQIFYTCLNNHKPPEKMDFAWNVGYEVLGPMLWGFCWWLNQQFEKMQPDKVFFLSREGDLIRRAYNSLYPDSHFSQEYLYVSRWAVQSPLLGKCSTYDEMLQLLKPLMHTHSLENIGKACQFDERYGDKVKALGLHLTDNVFELPPDKQELYLNLVLELGKDYFEHQYILMRRYLRQAGFGGRAAIVDIGWQGTMQRVLLSCAGEDISEAAGFYYGVRNSGMYAKGTGTSSHGYLFEPGRNEKWNLKCRFTNEVLETLFLNGDGSVKRYTLSEDGFVIPVLGVNEQEISGKAMLKQMQEAALLFLSGVGSRTLWEGCVPDPDTVMTAYDRFAVRPAMETIRSFRKFRFMDGGVSKILPQHSTAAYLLRPWRLIKEMDASACKIFFLKDVFKLPLPYFEILEFLVMKTGIKSQYRKNMER